MLNVIILAGGEGSRVKHLLKDTPKILAPINGKPFIQYLLNWIELSLEGTSYNLTIATGIGHSHVQSYLYDNSIDRDINLVKENRKLGTLGAAVNALHESSISHQLVINGDTLFNCNFSEVYKIFLLNHKIPLLIVKESIDNTRYGGYNINKITNKLMLASCDSKYISMGALFVHKDVLLERYKEALFKGKKEPMMDEDLVNTGEAEAFVISKGSRFIDIGTDQSLRNAFKDVSFISALN